MNEIEESEELSSDENDNKSKLGKKSPTSAHYMSNDEVVRKKKSQKIHNNNRLLSQDNDFKGGKGSNFNDCFSGQNSVSLTS